MSGRMAKAKGAGGEREVIQLLERWGREVGVPLDLSRNLEQVRSGGSDVNGVPGLEIEVKRQETLSLPSWWRQVTAQANKTGKRPLLVYRQNRQPWRFQVLSHQAIYGPSQSMVVECVVQMDIRNAEQWFKYWLYLHKEEIE